MNRIKSRAKGFTLIEVLVAIVVTAAGLLGLAKMQALAISSTKIAGSQSLIALQVGSLASAMSANSAYWASGSAPSSFTVSQTTISNSTLATVVADGCATKCTSTNLAAMDVQAWAGDMNNQFPTYSAKIDCTTTKPINCTIFVTWSETTIAVNKATATGSAQTETKSFGIHVNP